MTIRTRNEHPFLRWLAKCLGMAILLSPAMTVAQNDSTVMRVERLQIDHRDPSTIREHLLPLLSGRESIGVIGDWLVVAATDGTRNRIRERLEELDTAIDRLDMELSFTSPGETDDPNGDADAAAGSETVNRQLTLEPGQTVRVDLPAGAMAAADDADGEEATRQISLRVTIDDRQVHLDYALHPAEEPVDPATGTRQTLRSDNWHPLSAGIEIRVRPQY